MRRGPSMPRGIALAVPLALKRGHVMVFVPSLTNLGEFMIAGNGWFVIVRIRLARKFYASITEIEAEFREAITGLGLVPRSGPVSCELWLYSRYGSMRHFRVGDAGIVEIDCYGTPLCGIKQAAGVTAPSVVKPPDLSGPAAPGPSATGSADSRGPVLRWLKKRNAARISGWPESRDSREGSTSSPEQVRNGGSI